MSLHEMRARVDSLRNRGGLGNEVDALIREAVSNADRDAAMRGATAERGHAVHRCPWHTCQATRHN
jgi:hypothetical protein